MCSSDLLLDDLSVPEILQAMFSLAEELKIHFFSKDHTSSPLQTKQMLIENPDTAVFVVINRQVDRQCFEQVKKNCISFLSTSLERPKSTATFFIHPSKVKSGGFFLRSRG